MSDGGRRAALLEQIEKLVPAADDAFVTAEALLTPEEEQACRERASLSEIELFVRTSERLELIEIPTDPEERQRVQAAVMFGVLADRYREVVIEAAAEKRKMFA